MKKVLLLLLFINFSYAQLTEIDNINLMLEDFVFLSNKFVSPLSEVSSYQSAIGWVNSAKKRKPFQFTLGINNNLFLVPKKNREFEIKSSELLFFDFENGASTATIPTVLGNDERITFIGYLSKDTDGNPTDPVTINNPSGINQELVPSAQLYGTISLWKGTELMGKFAPKIKIENIQFQLYGVGIKHNLSQYFPYFEKKKINIATALSYSKQEIFYNRSDVVFNSSILGTRTLGVSLINGNFDTWQAQLNFSKVIHKFEFMGSFIGASNSSQYRFAGEEGTIQQIIDLRKVLNEKFEKVNEIQNVFLGELSCRYQISKLYLQTTLAFGKFVNSNLSLQYEF